MPGGQLVAIKVLDIDNADYKSVRDMKDESIKDFIHETKVMKQVKDSGAKNVNMIIEAISIHSQLWLVCEYCPGGSVKTLVSVVFILLKTLADVSFCCSPVGIWVIRLPSRGIHLYTGFHRLQITAGR